MNSYSRIFVAGHKGLVGSAICRALRAMGHSYVLTADRRDCDLSSPAAVEYFFSVYEPEYVFLAAAKVGGIIANRDRPADFLMQNLQIQASVISNAAKYHTKKLLFFGSACAYPKHAPTPVRESSLLCGELESTNRSYAIAKIAGIEMCRAYRNQHGSDFVSCMPTNLYGIGDHYDRGLSHVLPGMITRMHDAKQKGDASVMLWGSGKPKRDFLFADDLADASIFLMNNWSHGDPINIASGEAVQLRALAEMVKETVGFAGEIFWDTSKPDGTPDRTMDTSWLGGLGWKSKTPLREGIKAAYSDFLCRQR